MLITPEQLAEIYACPLERAVSWTPSLNAAMLEFKIDTPKRIAAFLAQIGHESGKLLFTKEIWGPTNQQLRYERNFDAAWPPTKEDNRNSLAYRLGNEHKGDGEKCMGRTPVQLTGAKNYKLCGDALGIDFLENPSIMEHRETGSRVAAWFWRIGAGLNLGHGAHLHGVEDGCDLNDYADIGDFESITYAINGGLNGQLQRVAFYNSAKRILGVA